MRSVWDGLRNDRRMWRAAPSSPLVREGVEVVDDLLDGASCARLVARFDELHSGRAELAGAAYFVQRARGATGKDQHVVQLMHAQDVDEQLRGIHESGRIEALFAERLGEPFVLESTTIQLDDPDVATKRGFHVDRVTPPTFKLFTYLTPVPDRAHGPYTVIPGSHRHLARKLINVAWNRLRRRQATDMSLFYRLRSARSLLGPAGQTIVSAQTMVHRGWPHHEAARRLVLICYLIPERHWSGREFDLGRSLGPEA